MEKFITSTHTQQSQIVSEVSIFLQILSYKRHLFLNFRSMQDHSLMETRYIIKVVRMLIFIMSYDSLGHRQPPYAGY